MSGFTFDAAVWRWPGEAAWHFVTLPEAVADEVRRHVLSEGLPRAGGMVRVSAAIGGVRWTTSLFPSKARDYLLPLKASVRRQANVGAGDEVRVDLHLSDATAAPSAFTER